MKRLSIMIAAFLILMIVYAEAAEQHVTMEIEGMTCDLCTLAIKKSLEGVTGVKTEKISFKEKKVWLSVDESVNDGILMEAVRKAGGYKGKILERESNTR